MMTNRAAHHAAGSSAPGPAAVDLNRGEGDMHLSHEQVIARSVRASGQAFYSAAAN